MSQRRNKFDQFGFSLLEMLIAFAILAIALGIILKIFSTGLAATQAADNYTNAVQIANNLIAKTGLEIPLKAHDISGIEKNYHWRLRVSPHQLISSELDVSDLPVQLFQVYVVIEWGQNINHLFELSTLKITNKDVDNP